jgi:hypothetical protein
MVPCELCWRIVIAQPGPEKLTTITHERLEITARLAAGPIPVFSIQIDRPPGRRRRTKVRLASPEEFGRDLFGLWDLELGACNKPRIAEVFIAKYVSPAVRRVRDEPDLSCFPALARFDSDLEEVVTSFRFLSEYDIVPDIARASTEQLPFAQMAPNGGAVGEVIDALQKQQYRKLDPLELPEAREGYGADYVYGRLYPSWWHYRRFYRGRQRSSYDDALENINRELSAAVRPITHVSVEIDPSNGRRFVAFKAEEDAFAPQEVSDGTVKWLCILVSLFVPFSRVYLLEEPENFLHPWMQQRLISIMREQAGRNKTIFMLASHSATILNSARPEEILIVKQGTRGTEVSAMADLASVKIVLAESDFHLGDLWVSGVIGGVPPDE